MMIPSRYLGILLASIACVHDARAIDVEPIAKEHRPIVVTHEPGVEVNILFWQDGAPQLLDESHIVRMTDRTIWSAPAGTYSVIRQGSAIVTVSRESSPRPDPDPEPKPDPPDPDPGPDPEPEPEPEPGIVAKWAIVVEEVQDRGNHPEQTTTLNDPRFRDLMDERGLKLRIYDDDMQSAAPFVRVAGDERPALILMTEDGSEHRAFPFPSSVEDAETILRENLQR